MTARLDAVVVGAGVIGLAIARALSRTGRDVVILEAEPTIGAHGSSRNSEVVHAGIYYPPGSLKATLCLEGKRRLYAYCDERSIACPRIGKLIVASEDREVAMLEQLRDNAQRSGLTDLELLDDKATRVLEPSVRAVGGLWSPSTGIIDSHGFLRALLADAREHGAQVAFRCVPTRIDAGKDELVVFAGDTQIRCSTLFNAAGLGAQDVARRVDALDASQIPRRYLAKGTYFTLRGASPFSHLVYPVPASASLGVHVTLDLAGAARFGPDQEWVDAIDYELAPGKVNAFYESIRRYWPDLPDDALVPGYAGVRAKVQAPGEPMADFVIQGPRDHAVPGLVNLFGIESPGLTASLAIADECLRRLDIDPE